MPDINQVENKLYGYHETGMAGSLSTPVITEISFKPGELNKKEAEHARAVACIQYIRLIWYVQEMRKTGCRYKQAVVTVNKCIKELN